MKFLELSENSVKLQYWPQPSLEILDPPLNGMMVIEDKNIGVNWTNIKGDIEF